MSRSHPLRVVLATIVLTALTYPLWSAPGKSTGAQASWPQWRGPDRNGLSPEKGLNTDWTAKTPKLLWMVEGTGRGFSSLSVSEGQIYTVGKFPEGEAVVALDGADGRVLWKSGLTSRSPGNGGYEGPRSTPTVDGENLFAISSDGKVACLSRKNGMTLWSRDFKEWGGKMHSGWGYSESPLVDGNLVICTPGAADAMVVALDKRTGQEVWKSAVPSIGSSGGDGAAYSSIVISNAGGVKQYVQLIGRGLIGVRASDGKFLWGYNRVANGVANIPTPIVRGDYVFCSSGYGTGAALLKIAREGDGVQATEVYFLNGRTFQNHHGGMILVGDHVYAGHGHTNGIPICIELESGKIVWGGNKRGEGSGSAAIVYADGHIIFRYEDGKVALVQATPAGYRLKGTLTPAHQERKSWSHPVVVGGKLYLREQNKLMCYDLSKNLTA
jgi:outer membrane protein assembly factor BamB